MHFFKHFYAYFDRDSVDAQEFWVDFAKETVRTYLEGPSEPVSGVTLVRRQACLEH